MTLHTASGETASGVTGRSPTARALLWLEILLAVGAYAGALGLITEGIDIGEAAAKLPFGSMVFAGIALLVVNGLLPTAVVIGEWLHHPWAGVGHVAVGVALTSWIVVQVGVLGWPPHWLQILYFGWGCTILILALRQRAGR
jgi:hypothetical protein